MKKKISMVDGNQSAQQIDTKLMHPSETFR